jgi:hypothetical protein
MKIFSIISLWIVCLSAHAADPVTITREVETIQACHAVGTVRSNPPYFLPGADLKDIRAQALALRADTVLITARMISTSGVAYRCRP